MGAGPKTIKALRLVTTQDVAICTGIREGVGLRRRLMSALGQKQTCAVQQRMSA